jgi:hypothetical protein
MICLARTLLFSVLGSLLGLVLACAYLDRRLGTAR